MYTVGKCKFLAFAVLILSGCHCSSEGTLEVTNQNGSPSFEDFIESLNKAPVAERKELVDQFMDSVPDGGFPVVEGTLAHFVYRNQVSSTITVAGDFNNWDPAQDPMNSVEGTDFHYLTRVFELDARLDYKFVIGGSQWILDPLNSETVTGGFGPNSELAMPEYVQPAEIEFVPGIPHGRTDTFTHQSSVLGNSRNVFVYLPPDYDDDAEKRYPSLYVNDGGEYKDLASMNNVVDYLLNGGEISGVIVVFVNPVNRNTEYSLNPSYKEMIVSELVPRIDSSYRTIDSAAARGIMGASLGGLVSVYIAYEHPDVFGLSAGQSGAFYVNGGQLIDSIESGPVEDVRFYLDWGTYEPGIMDSNYSMREVLISKGYSLVQNEYHEGHSWGSWRAHTDNILRTFFPPGGG
jgi:enterochelin esterase family protein